MLPPLSVTYKKLPVGSTPTAIGEAPFGKGDPVTGTSRFVIESASNAEMSKEEALETKTSLPEGSAAVNSGTLPTRKGEPATVVRTPVAGST